MDQSQFKWIANFIWNIANDRLKAVHVRGKYRDHIQTMVEADILGAGSANRRLIAQDCGSRIMIASATRIVVSVERQLSWTRTTVPRTVGGMA